MWTKSPVAAGSASAAKTAVSTPAAATHPGSLPGNNSDAPTSADPPTRAKALTTTRSGRRQWVQQLPLLPDAQSQRPALAADDFVQQRDAVQGLLAAQEQMPQQWPNVRVGKLPQVQQQFRFGRAREVRLTKEEVFPVVVG